MTSTTHSESDTADIAFELASDLGPGAVILLFGDLGAGKTAFTRGLAMGLGVPEEDVSSPTFTIMQEYRGGRLPLFHVDLYRLNDPREIEDLGLDEIAADGVLAVEWAEKLRDVPPDALRVRLAHGDADVREIEIRYSER